MKKTFFPLVLLFALGSTLCLSATERIPPPPARYFNDYAGVVSKPVAEELNTTLEEFERTSSNQLLVAIFPKMESDSSVEDYTVRVAQAWRAGQQKKSNGAVLFAFMQEHQLYIQVGYGLEAVLPDAIAKRIVETEIVPRFRRNDVDGGMRAAVLAMIAATKGEYAGSGSTQAERQGQRSSRNFSWVGVLAFIMFFAVISRRRSRRNYMFGPRGGWWMGPPSGGGGWSSGGGGGGFSGGGGSFGGGGAGGKW